jgi:hypothetical protein
MANAKKSSSKPAASRRPKQETALLSRLSHGEAGQVLARLLEAHQELLAEAEGIARSVLGEVSFEAVACDVEFAVRGVDLDELEGRAGSHSWGYTDPGDAAYQLLEEAVQPFMEDMKRHLALGLEREAFEICKGIILGLYQLRDDTGDEFLEWAPDFPAEAADDAAKEWLTGARQGAGGGKGERNRIAPLREFVEAHVPEWEWISKQAGGSKSK